MALDQNWLDDLKRYPEKRPFLKEQSIWAIWVYRFGRRVNAMQPSFLRKLYSIIYHLMFKIIETLTGISIYQSVQIGGGLKIWHFGNIFIHSDVVIGENCTLRQGVTIGNRIEGGPVPVLGDNVELGAYAQVLGGIRLGNNCKIGAMSLVLIDIPDGATAVGVPARIIHQ